MSDAEHKKSLGYREGTKGAGDWEPESSFIERMSGLVCLWAAIVQTNFSTFSCILPAMSCVECAC